MKNRDPYFDNLKAVLIFLVVLGHFTDLNRSHTLIGGINNVIYSFHMPVFIFLTGYFSKNIHSQKAGVKNIIYTYILFQILNYCFNKFTGLGLGSNIFIPIYQNWFLIGLIVWRLLIPYFNITGKATTLMIVLLISFSIGFVEQFKTLFGLYRVIYFLPLFIVGYYCRDLKMLLNKYSYYKPVTIVFSILVFIAVFFFSYSSYSLNDAISFAFTPYSTYGSNSKLFLFRLICFFICLPISCAFLFIIPQQHTFYTRFGENTLNVFLTHIFFVLLINSFFIDISETLLLFFAFISSLLITFILSSQLANKLLMPFTKLDLLIVQIKKIVTLD